MTPATRTASRKIRKPSRSLFDSALLRFSKSLGESNSKPTKTYENLTQALKDMTLENVRKFTGALGSTGNPWHEKVSSLVEACCMIVEDIDSEETPEEWTDKDCSQFLESSIDVLMGTIANLVDKQIAQVENYFSSPSDPLQLQELRELGDDSSEGPDAGEVADETEEEDPAEALAGG